MSKPNSDITLSNGFQLAQDDYDRITTAIFDGEIISSCVVRSDLFRKAANPEEYAIVGSNATYLRGKGLLASDNSMPNDVRVLVLLAFGYHSAGDVQKSDLETPSCPYPNPTHLQPVA